jgi:DNA-3-methyladenine glycosylase
MKLTANFYLDTNVVQIAQNLLGKILCTNINNKLTKIRITETEAYNGIHDKACHAFGGRRTKRTETMYAQGGISYVYLCYGMHYLFNVVTNTANTPDAVLIRGGMPIAGIESMEARRNKKTEKLISGPGKISKALGINMQHNALSLLQNTVWIEDDGYTPINIVSTKRIGIDYAGEDAELLYRFLIST